MEQKPIKSPIQKEDITESKVQESIESLTEKAKTNDSDVFLSAFLKALKGEKGDQGDKGDKGEDGKDYKLTELDKKSIANTVYSIVQDRLDEDTDEVVSDALIVLDKRLPEKIKTALEEQKPFIKEVISEYLETLKKNNTEYNKRLEDKIEKVSTSLKSDVKQTLDNFWESKKKEISKQYKPETAEKIVEKIKKKISWHDLIERPNIVSGLAHLVDVSIETKPTNGQVLKWNSTSERWVPGTDNTGGGGSSIETPTGTVDGSNVTFTVTETPLYIVADGITYFEGAGYSLAGLTITMDSKPFSYIRSFY